MHLKLHGKLTAWDDGRGYGFITPLSGGERIFVHIKAFRSRRGRPRYGQEVCYAIARDQQGRLCATSVHVVGKTAAFPMGNGRILLAAIIGGFFLALVGGTEYYINRSALIGIVYLAASLLSFALYARDKQAAMRGKWRVPEANLHLPALLGGWPGAMVAQQAWRHKSKKREFRTLFWTTVAINCAATAWLMTPRGILVVKTAETTLLHWMHQILQWSG